MFLSASSASSPGVAKAAATRLELQCVLLAMTDKALAEPLNRIRLFCCFALALDAFDVCLFVKWVLHVAGKSLKEIQDEEERARRSEQRQQQHTQQQPDHSGGFSLR